MSTVKEGQIWTSEWVKSQGEKLGLDIKTYWRQPPNGIDWNLELIAGDAAVQVSIWFLHLKRLNEESTAKIQDTVLEGLKKLESGPQVKA